jgi:ribosomal protein S18 acetylase RimI-like enzyme
VSDVRIRVLSPADAVAVRDLRLEGLRLHPESFGSAWEEEAPQPLHVWEAKLAEHGAHWLGAEVDGALVGLTVVSLNARMKLAHNAHVGAVYVRDQFHRRGIARALMQSAMEYLRTSSATHATLTVSANNEAARKLYESFGFVVCGQLQAELNVDGRFHDELMMRTGFFAR